MIYKYKNHLLILSFALIIGIFFISSFSFNNSLAQQEDPAKHTTDLYLSNTTTANITSTITQVETPVLENESDSERLACLTVEGFLGEGSKSMPFSTGVQKKRILRDGVASTCNGKPLTGTITGTFKYDSYRFENTSSEERCVSIKLNKVNCNNTGIFATAYLGCFNPNDITQNYIADSGSSASNQLFSFLVPAKEKFVVVVSSVSSGDLSCANYSFSMTGMQDCGNPDFNLACGKGAPLEHKMVFFTDTANNRIQMTLNDGTTWTTVGKGQGDNTGQFNNPHGVAANASGSVIFVADTLNNRIQRSLDSGATWQIMAGNGTRITNINSPQALAYDENADILYIADTNNNRILKVTNATTKATFSTFAGSTGGRAIGQFDRPRGIAVDALGKVYVADTGNSRIQVSTTGQTGGWALFAGASAGSSIGKVNSPVGIFVDSLNRVYIADTGNNRIQINKDGSPNGWIVFMGTGSEIGSVNGPEGITLSASGNVFIGDTLNNRIQRKSIIGGLGLVVSSPGVEVGQANLPTSVR
jgi:sugar lactone lactonase YvrE